MRNSQILRVATDARIQYKGNLKIVGEIPFDTTLASQINQLWFGLSRLHFENMFAFTYH